MTQTPEKTLRDEFAMAALTGMMATRKNTFFHPKDDAKYVYELADAMLAERMKWQ